MKAREFMITDVIVAHPQDTIGEVLTTLVERKIGGVPIVDEQGVLVGVVSDGDILRAIRPQEGHVVGDYMMFAMYIDAEEMEPVMERKKDLPVMDVARKKRIITVKPDEEMEKVIRLFAGNHFKKLPVVNGANRVVGVISRGDVLRHVQQTLLKHF